MVKFILCLVYIAFLPVVLFQPPRTTYTIRYPQTLTLFPTNLSVQMARCCPSGDCAAETARLRTELDSTPKCVACLTRDRDTLLFPCKHLVLCGPCYSELMRCAAEPDEHDDDPYPTPTLARCPTCRAEICGHISGVIIS